MKFFSSYNPGLSEAEPECPKELQNYCYNELTCKLEKTDKIPFYKEIQSHYESTKLSTKLTAYSMGDFTALGFERGSFVDVSGQNTNLATILNTNEVAKGEFNKLPADVKQLFNFDYTEFVRSVESGSFEKRIANFIKSKSGTEGAKSGTEGSES